MENLAKKYVDLKSLKKASREDHFQGSGRENNYCIFLSGSVWETAALG